jgi:hypothetical protein
MPVDLGDSVTRSINLTNTAGVPVAADSTPTYAITKPDGTAGTPPSVQTGVTGEYYVVYPTATLIAGLYRELWTAIVGGVTITLPRVFVVEDPLNPPFVGTDEALAHLRANNVISGPVDLEQLRWLCMVASDSVERDLGIEISRRTVTEVYDGGEYVVLLRSSPVISITSVTESGSLLTVADWTADIKNGILWRGAAASPRCFLWGRQNVIVVYVVGYIDPPRIARKVALNGVERMWQSSQQTSHPLLDDVSGTEAIFAAVGTLTPLELGAYRSLQTPGTA